MAEEENAAAGRGGVFRWGTATPRGRGAEQNYCMGRGFWGLAAPWDWVRQASRCAVPTPCAWTANPGPPAASRFRPKTREVKTSLLRDLRPFHGDEARAVPSRGQPTRTPVYDELAGRRRACCRTVSRRGARGRIPRSWTMVAERPMLRGCGRKCRGTAGAGGRRRRVWIGRAQRIVRVNDTDTAQGTVNSEPWSDSRRRACDLGLG